MTLAFDEVKATQTAALFLRLAGARLNYTALIKLLYKADREALRKWGLPITTDRYVNMKMGPVTSRIYDRIKSGVDVNAHPSFWSTHIQRAADDPYSLVLSSDPGDSELSRAEESLIEQIFAEHGHKDYATLVGESHKEYPEWNDPGESSSTLDLADIISALGFSEEEAASTESLIEAQRAASDLAA
jgi:uncharacterized phage-associated protein